MSNTALRWAFRLSVKPATAKFVLVAMADCVDDQNLFFGSTEWICNRTGLDRKTALRSVAALASAGLITDTGDRRGATRSVVVYRVNVGSGTEFGTAKQSQNGYSFEPKAVPLFPSSSTAFPQKLSQKRDTDPKRTQRTPKTTSAPRQEHPLFERWYNAYPVKKARGQARKAFSKIDPDDQLVDAMVDAVERQTRERATKQRLGAFVPPWKHPATWLNGECWNDEPIDDIATGEQCPHDAILDLYEEILPELLPVPRPLWKGSPQAQDLEYWWNLDEKHRDLNFWRWFFEAIRGNAYWMGETGGQQRGLGWFLRRDIFPNVVSHGLDRQRRSA